MTTPTMRSLKDEIRSAGFTPSEASWEDAQFILAFSRETTPGTYGHPAFETSYCKATRWLKIDGQPNRRI